MLQDDPGRRSRVSSAQIGLRRPVAKGDPGQGPQPMSEQYGLRALSFAVGNDVFRSGWSKDVDAHH